MKIRKSQDRGHADHGWLNTYHTFSFANYFDSQFMGFHSIRVINEDRILSNAGFPQHPHKNMEIITYIVEGALAHKDSMGYSTVINKGDVQRMSAGSGITHSEFNANPDQICHLFQIWIHPNQINSKPSYEQKSFLNELKNNKLVLVISQNARDGSIAIQQDTDIYLSHLKNGEELEYSIKPMRSIWLQLIKGSIRIENFTLTAGDAISIENQIELLKVLALEDCEFILFDNVKVY